MSDILCRWLNQDLRLSKAVESDTFASDFSSGYLIGEVLHKYQLQKDFSMFMKKDTSISKVNNFTRIEPTLKLLGMSFDINTAQDLMQEKQGAATHLLHQLYVLLEKNKKAEIGGTMMEIMQPAANANLHKKEHEIYSDVRGLYRYVRELHVRLDDGHIAFVSLLFMQTVQTEIAQFETNRKKLVTSGFGSSSSGQPFPTDFLLGSGSQACEVPGSETKMTLQSNSKYIQEIRQRLEENAVACEQRKKRVDRFLVEQFKAHEAQEEAQREEQLVRRLTRQTRQEQRLATQLLQMRMQKEVIRENRLFREQQYQQRRERDFREALDREAVLAQQAKLDCAEEIGKELEFCNRIAAERAQNRYKKHFQICKDILEQITDLATKVGEYRLLTGNLIPGKLMREWKELLFRGLPLFEPVKGHRPEFSTPLDPVELKKQDTLNDQDYDEYTHMVGEWTWPEEAGETQLPPGNNNVLGHVVHRLRNIVHPPVMEPSPVFPHFSIKACVLGKICSGKTTSHGICVLSADSLIEEAVNAYKNGEEVSQIQNNTQSGWILDGFPVDITQAHLLEKALGGSVGVEKEVLNSRTNLAADPNPPKPPPPPAPVLDLAMLLDVPDACAVKRAFSHIGTLHCQQYFTGQKCAIFDKHCSYSYLFLGVCREGYKHYLGRPDLKQELVSQWQKDFNGVPDNMREDEETTAELHMRLDGLRERLWDISDKRKEEDEQERDALLYDNWLEDHTAVLINHHSALMQVTLQFLSNQLTEGISYFIDQLSDVVFHHIEAGDKLQNKLVLKCSDFYLNGDCHMVPSHAPPRPPPLEKPTQSTPTIIQLESLHRKLCNIAPSGTYRGLFSQIKDTLNSFLRHRHFLFCLQVMELVSLLMDEYKLIDWRRFVLSAALPWPFPSLTQLLAVLQRFRAADAGDTGYVHKEQYLKIELWFSNESVQTVPEDPSEPVPYDRLANLREFFFQLFADHSFSPPRLDYVSMLQYFAADPNPRQGFIRALSVVLGQHLKHSSLDHLVKSMPCMEEATELTSIELDGNYKEEETPGASGSLSEEQEVSISALLAVICHQVSKMKDSTHCYPECPSQEKLTEVYPFESLNWAINDIHK
uniref:Calponin-homology (CH) domain-containing protein n=1 Tax=Amphiprion ocellaris TaxID=80972 RepID=A0A3Q1BV47_AMPOC